MKKLLNSFLVFAASATVVPRIAFAWGDLGHMTVCEIAERNFTNTTLAAVNTITGNRPFARQCLWPDQVKKTSDWKNTRTYHMVDVEDDDYWASGSEALHKGDLLQQAMRAKVALGDSETSQKSKLCHLRFLGHIAGDSHQPLHVGRTSDLGGNKIKAEWMGASKFKVNSLMMPEGQEKQCEEKTHEPVGSGCVVVQKKENDANLHMLWDDAFIDMRARELGIVVNYEAVEPSKSAAELANAFLQENTFEQTNKNALMWDDILRWVEFAFTLREVAYDKTGLNTSVVQPGAELESLANDVYYRNRISLISSQIVRAGIHLAGQLNRIYDSEFSPALQNSNTNNRLIFHAARENEIAARVKNKTTQKFNSLCDGL